MRSRKKRRKMAPQKATKKPKSTPADSGSEYCHNKFLSYEEIGDFLLKVSMEFPQRTTVDIVGESSEGRPIYLTKITDPSSEAPKMAALVEAGSNGADWLAVSSALYLIHALSRSSRAEPMDYLVLPCLNPDGYHDSFSCEFSRPHTNLSNNYPVTLGLNDITLQRTEEVLQGVRKWKESFKFEAPESLALIRTITSHQFSVKLFISLQEEGEKIVYPFGFCKERIVDCEQLRSVAKAGQAAVKKRCLHVGSVMGLCGLTFGTVIDFLRINQQAIKFTYILHLRDKHKAAEPKNILRNGCEATSCIQAMAKEIHKHYSGSSASKTCA